MSKIRSNVNPRLLPTLFFAGRAVLTLHNQAAGTHCTLKVRQVRDKQDRTKKLPTFYVSVSLLGDHETGTRFAATYFQTTGTYKLGRDVQPTDQLARVMAFVHQALKNPTMLRDRGVSLLHEGACCRCGRALTHPQSIDTGFGPECWSRVLQESPSLAEEEVFQNIPANPA